MTNRRHLFLMITVLILISLSCSLPVATENNVATEPPVVDPTIITSTTTVPVVEVTNTVAAPVGDPTNTPISPAATATSINNENCLNESEFVADVNIPDGKLLKAGSTFTKTWRIRNSGGCTWTSDYTWVQIGGSKIQAAQVSMPLSGNVAPGQELEISVELNLSTTADQGERYSAQFQMYDPDGEAFGTHPFVLIYASPGAAVCPVSYLNYATYISAIQGFCLLYPDTYTMNNTFADPDRIGVQLTAPHPGGGGEVMLASLGINVEGSAGGLTSEQFATQKVNDWKIPATTPLVTMVDLDGTPAYYTDELPGQFGNRIILTVHDGTAYVMTLMPIDGVFPTQTAEAEVFFDLLLSSFTWIN